MADVWPAEVPETLWTYHALTMKPVEQVPMMGVHFANNFLVATAAGALFLLVFARDRFMNQRRQAEEGSYLVLTKLGARDLGGGNALRKAYLIYATVLLVIYFSLTFFGNLIFGLTNQLPVAGIEVDVSTIPFDQPTWPLAVAFGLAGLAPLLRPAQIAEDWLRERAYRAVGIPTRIQKTTRKIIAGLDSARLPPPDPSAESGGSEKVAKKKKTLRDMLTERRKRLEDEIAGTWIDAALGRGDRRDEFLSLHAQLEALVLWARGARGAWPGIEVADSVLALERGVLDQAEKLLKGLDERLAEAKFEVAAEMAAAAAKKKPSAEDAQRLAIRRQRRGEYLDDTLARMRTLRGDLAAVVAVFVERDPVTLEEGVSEIHDEALDGLLLSSEQPPVAAGPEISLGLAILCFMPVYAAFVWKGWHPVFAPTAESRAPIAILVTIGLEALRQTLILWLPVMTAFSVRQYLIDEDRWTYKLRGDAIEYLRQRAAAIAIAVIVAFLGLVALAALWAFLQAVSETRYKSLLFEGGLPFLLFYPTMFFVAAPMVWSALAGADARARGRWGWSVGFGMAGALLVFVAEYLHVGTWYAFGSCTEDGPYFLLSDIAREGCFRDYGGLDFIVYPLLAFLTAVFFGNPEQRSRRQSRNFSQRSHGRGDGSITAAAAAVAVVAAAILLAWASLARAAPQGGSAALAGRGELCEAPLPRVVWRAPASAGVSQACPPPARQRTADPLLIPVVGPDTPPEGKDEGNGKIPRTVRLGFRTDAEPFSFRRENSSGGWKYAGYVADLCHEIFAGPDFVVTEVPVTAENRFDKLKDDGDGPNEDGKIDVLCDPVTLRLSDPERHGLYSPIIFASGVSYLRVVQRQPGARVQIAFVQGSTAEGIARKACEVDLFVLVPPKDRANLPIICATNWAASQLTHWQHLASSKQASSDGADFAEAFLDAASLQRRWAEADLETYSDDLRNRLCGFGTTTKACRRQRDALLKCLTGQSDHPWLCQQIEKEFDARRNIDDLDALKALSKRIADWKNFEATDTGSCKVDSTDKKCMKEMETALVNLGYDQRCNVVDNNPSKFGEEIFYRFCPLEKHDEAISWLCSRRLNSALNQVYMGDRDIIVGKLRSWERHHGACPVENAEGADNLTYEPYALLFRKDACLAETIQRGVYDFFSRRTHAVEVFEAYFPNKVMSVPLSYLFLLNAVEEEQNATMRPDAIEPSVPVPPNEPADTR